jgi:hypothetical protein
MRLENVITASSFLQLGSFCISCFLPDWYFEKSRDESGVSHHYKHGLILACRRVDYSNPWVCYSETQIYGLPTFFCNFCAIISATAACISSIRRLKEGVNTAWDTDTMHKSCFLSGLFAFAGLLCFLLLFPLSNRYQLGFALVFEFTGVLSATVAFVMSRIDLVKQAEKQSKETLIDEASALLRSPNIK